MTGLILPEIVYNARKKLGCIFIENHNSTSLDLQQGQTIGCVTSCVVKQEELGQRPGMCRKDMPGVTERINDSETCVGSATRSDAEKAGSVHSLRSRQCYETEEEK